MNDKVLRFLSMEYNSIINPIVIYKDISTLPFQELMGTLKNAKIKVNLWKKREQNDDTQIKKKSLALKGTQDESSSEDSTNEDDNLSYVIKKANKMMKKKFNKKRNFQRLNGREDETGSINCYECNKLGHIKKDSPNLKGKRKVLQEEKSLICWMSWIGT